MENLESGTGKDVEKMDEYINLKMFRTKKKMWKSLMITSYQNMLVLQKLSTTLLVCGWKTLGSSN